MRLRTVSKNLTLCWRPFHRRLKRPGRRAPSGTNGPRFGSRFVDMTWRTDDDEPARKNPPGQSHSRTGYVIRRELPRKLLKHRSYRLARLRNLPGTFQQKKRPPGNGPDPYDGHHGRPGKWLGPPSVIRPLRIASRVSSTVLCTSSFFINRAR